MPRKTRHFKDVTSTDIKGIPLLDKFLCRICEKWKTPTQFSNKEMNEYRWKKKNSSVNGTTARVRCRLCAGDQAHELLCNGPCDLYKSADDFSKTQRTRPEVAWCMACTTWKEACEPEIIPEAPPGTILSPDEDANALISSSTAYVFADGGGIEGDGVSDDDDDDYDVYRSISEMSISHPCGSVAGHDIATYSDSDAGTIRGGFTGQASFESQLPAVPSYYQGNTYGALGEDNETSSTATGYYSAVPSNPTTREEPPTAASSGFDPNSYRTVPPATKATATRASKWAKPAGGRKNPPTSFPAAVAPSRYGQARRVDDDSETDDM